MAPELQAIDAAKMQQLEQMVKDTQAEIGNPDVSVKEPGDGPFDPSEYAIDPKVANLYSRARWVTEGGVRKLITVVVDTWSVTKWINAPSGQRFWPAGQKNAGEAIALADFITQAENSTEGWRLFAVIPNGREHATAFLRRAEKIELTVPPRLDAPVPTAEPTENPDDLEAKAKAWEQEQQNV